MGILREVFPYWRSLILFLAPLILLPLPVFGANSASRCGYVIILMAVFWATEVVPLSATALIPVFAFPLLGIMSTGEVCITYMKETNMMFLGGLAAACAVEHCNLHKRIALFVIVHIGQSPRMLMAGFMFTTMFLSMWISNTASTAMMVPIISAILDELGKIDEERSEFQQLPPSQSQAGLMLDETEQDISLELRYPKMRKKKHDAFRNMIFLSVAYAANIGGTGTMTGTSPNLVMKDVLAREFGDETGLNFGSWMVFYVPGVVLCVFLAWIWLSVVYFSCRIEGKFEVTSTKRKAVKKMIKEKYDELGPMSFHENAVVTCFACLVLLWLFRSPGFVPGWADWIASSFDKKILIEDATPAMFIVFFLFVIPSRPNFWCFKYSYEESSKVSPGCLSWKVIHDKIPWGVILLLGGGFAIAKGSDESGLSLWLGSQLIYLKALPKGVIAFLMSLLTAVVTEVASNTATASILMPVLKDLALAIEVNPLYLMLPATACCSYAFMLPVATPSNAIVFAAADMKTTDMMLTGVVMNLICIIIITIMVNTLGDPMFGLSSFPSWANRTAA